MPLYDLQARLPFPSSIGIVLSLFEFLSQTGTTKAKWLSTWLTPCSRTWISSRKMAGQMDGFVTSNWNRIIQTKCHFPQADLNEAGRAADAAREVNGAVVACWLRYKF